MNGVKKRSSVLGTKERREREKEEIRQKILDAARELFVQEGYDAVSMRKIAERIEYSPTAIYLHFKDKRSVLIALCDEDFLRLARELQKIGRIEDPVERMRQSGRAYIRFALEHASHTAFADDKSITCTVKRTTRGCG